MAGQVILYFDDQADAKSQEPPLTTVHKPIYEIGYRALEALLAEIAGPRMIEQPW